MVIQIAHAEACDVKPRGTWESIERKNGAFGRIKPVKALRKSHPPPWKKAPARDSAMKKKFGVRMVRVYITRDR